MKTILLAFVFISSLKAQTTSFLSSLPSPRINRLRFEVPDSPQSINEPFFEESVQGERLVQITPSTSSSSQGGGFFPFQNFFKFFGLIRQTDSLPFLKDLKRNHNGSNNNFQHPLRGSAHIPLSRKCPALYNDGQSTPYFYKKSPRQISNILGQIEGDFEKSKLNMTMAFTIWGQFIDHDISLTEVNESETMDIQIPKCDQFMDKDCKGDQKIPFKRSIFESGSSPRNQMNIITAWIDGSMVYGSSKEVSDRLRKFQLGKLKEGSDRMLPKRQGDPHNLFDAGDIRANENMILTSYHTIFMREHNRVCQEIVKKNPTLTDDQIYQAARNYVIGLIQKITFQDFLPLLLGPKMYEKYIGQYKGYNSSINPSVDTQFSTSSFRIGHALLANKYPLINRYGQIQRQMTLNEMFFRPNHLNSSTIDNLIRGVSKTYLKQKSPEVISEIRNLLISGPEERHINLDLYALNLQRSVDHGIPPLNEVRERLGLSKALSFDEITKNKQRAKKLKEVYEHPDNCDLWIAIISEDPYQNGILGEVGAKIVGEQFARLRNGDRFWYEKDYPGSVAAEISSTTLSEIIMRNTGITDLQENVFFIKENL